MFTGLRFVSDFDEIYFNLNLVDPHVVEGGEEPGQGPGDDAHGGDGGQQVVGPTARAQGPADDQGSGP